MPIRDVKRTDLPDGVRITIEMDGEATFRAERVENPDRVFFDVKNASAAGALADKTVKFAVTSSAKCGSDGIPARLASSWTCAARESYSVFTLYEPVPRRRRFQARRGAAAAAGCRGAANQRRWLPRRRPSLTAPTPTPAQQVDAPLAKKRR